MRVGIFVAYWPWFSHTEQIELALLADEGGLDCVWVAEAWGADAVSMAGYLAAKTERIGLGTALMQIPARPPTATAMAAVTIDVLSGGRFRLGLGVSGPQVSEGWYGVRFARPVSRTREYIEIVRKALSGELVEHHGREFDLPLPDGLGKPLRLLAEPVQKPIPIYVGATGPKAVELVGEIADGWLPFMIDPDDPSALMDMLDKGLQKGGRTRADVDVGVAIGVGMSEDLDDARGAVRPLMAFYLGAMGAKEKNFYVDLADRAGFGDEARAIQDAWLGGDRGGAVGLVPDALLDQLCIACRPSELDDQLARFSDAGIDTMLAVPCGPDRPAIVRALAAAAGD